MADWREAVKEYEFRKYPNVKKAGIVKVKFLEEGRIVEKEITRFSVDSVIFTVEHEGEKKELWFSVSTPILRELAKMDLIGKELTLRFTGEGQEMRCEIVEGLEKPKEEGFKSGSDV